mgnify:CR=1 FL=1
MENRRISFEWIIENGTLLDALENRSRPNQIKLIYEVENKIYVVAAVKKDLFLKTAYRCSELDKEYLNEKEKR